MITCKECKHYIAEKHHGSCSRWNMGYRYDVESLPPNEVLVENDEGWGMVCGPDFGCILGEKRTRESDK